MTESSPLASLEYRFESSHDFDELAFELSGSPDSWLVRACPDPYLTTPAVADPEARGRIDCIGPGLFLFSGWSSRASAEALWSRTLDRSSARAVSELPAGGARALRECGAFQFDSGLAPDAVERALAASGVASVERSMVSGQSIVHWASSDADRLEEIIWLVRFDRGRPALELIYDGNPHDEARWRFLCARALDVYLPALRASAVEQPRDWTGLLQTMSRRRAWSFSSPGDLSALEARLTQATKLRWTERDSAHYGDYLSANRSEPYAELVRLRVFEDEGSYVLDMRWKSMHPQAPQRYRAIERWLIDEVLRTAGATAVADAETYD